MGASLGLIGSYLVPDVRAATASVFAVIGVVVAAIELTGRRVPLLERSRETPRRWVSESAPRAWAIRNGAALGLGFATRIGFWLWYVVPAASLLSGSLRDGAIVYGLYAAIRGFSVVALVEYLRVRQTPLIGDGLLVRVSGMRSIAAVWLLVVGLTVTVVIGL
jgi:hypothetical protein